MRYLALLSTLALILAACGGGGGGDAPTGTLKVMVTDDPFPFPADLVDSATVKIIRVEARNADLEGWQVLFDGEAVPEPDPEPEPPAEPPAEPAPEPEPLGPVELDLVELANGVSALLVEIEVPVGTYDEVRLIVDAGTVVLKAAAYVDADGEYPDTHTFDTENGNLRFPSGAQTGIKVKIANDIVVTSQLTTDLELEFDLANNFVFNGSPERDPGVKRINFTPVVRATNTSTKGPFLLQVTSTNGTPDDTTDDTPISGPTLVIHSVAVDEITLDEIETYVSTLTGGEDGTFSFTLPAGTYNFDVLARPFDPAELNGIPIAAANLYDAGIVALTPADFWLEGEVRSDVADPGEDTVLAGATVELWSADPDVDTEAAMLADTTTHASGMYVLHGLTPGIFFLRVSATGHETQDIEGVQVDPGVIATQDVGLTPTP